ncbi:MAG TPA: hypothetical protein VF058_07540, partial [Actinomycetota bacterium]
MRRFLSPAGLALAAFCFFLPFVSVSCNPGALEDVIGEELPTTGPTPFPGGFPGGLGQEVEVTAGTGWEIALGSEPELSETFGGLAELGGAGETTADEPWPGQAYAIAALALAVLGIVMALVLTGMPGALSGLIAGVGGAVMVFLIRTEISSWFEDELRADPQAGAILDLSFEIGWWLALAFFIVAAALAGWAMAAPRQPTEFAAPPPPATPPGGT